MTPKCVGSDDGLSRGRRQPIIWTNAGMLLIGPLGTNFSEIFIGIHTFSFKKMHLKMPSAKWRPFCLGPNVLTTRICVSADFVWHLDPWDVRYWFKTRYITHIWPPLLTWIKFNASMNKKLHYKVWDEITYPFPNFNGATVYVWEWISNLNHSLLSMWLLRHAGVEVKSC